MMLHKLTFFAAILAGIFLLNGCATSGVNSSIHKTEVQLSQANYEIVATTVSGEAEANYILGFSMGVGMFTHTYALIPLDSERDLYKQAMADLWKNFEEDHGNPEGQNLALVNLRYDSEVLNLFFYTKPKVTIVADVVRFK